MLERPTVTEQFSTFIELADDRFSRWATDARLLRSMKTVSRQIGDGPDGQAIPDNNLAVVEFWIAYWHKCWRHANEEGNWARLPQGHLIAFMQESCYWAAHKMARFPTNQSGLADYFQLAIARSDYILQHFSPEQSSKLEAYAYTAFCNIIRDTLRQRKELDVCSDWALLRRLSQKRLEESLRVAGLGHHVDHYVLAWRCYKLVYTPSAQTTRQLNQPDADLWQAIAREFNQQRRTTPPVIPSCDAATLSLWLQRCATAARAYLYPKATSLNATKPDQEGGELQDTIVNFEDDVPMDVMVREEEAAAHRAWQGELDQVLRQALPQLPAESQSILALYYRQGQTQQQVASVLDLKQYTVSRRLSKARETLLKQVAIWSRDTLHIALTSDVITDINAVLEEWLYRYYEAQPQDPHNDST